MRIEIHGVSQSIGQFGVFDKFGRQTGFAAKPILHVSAIPDGENPQNASMRITFEFMVPDDAALLRYRVGAVMDIGNVMSATGLAANARKDAALEEAKAAEEAKVAAELPSDAG